MKQKENMGLSISTYLMLGVQLSKEDFPEEVFNEYEENSQILFDEGLDIEVQPMDYADEKFVVGLTLGKLKEDELVCESGVASVDTRSTVENAIKSKIDIKGKSVKLILFHQCS